MGDKGIINGKILRTNTVDIRDSLNQFVYTTDLTKNKDLVNVAALNYVNNFNVTNGKALTHSQYTGSMGTSQYLGVYNVFKQKASEKLEFRNIASKRHITQNGDPQNHGVVVELYNDDIILSIDKSVINDMIKNYIIENLVLKQENTNVELSIDSENIGNINICDITDNCQTYYGNSGLGNL